MVKAANAVHISGLIVENAYRPQDLFTINSILNPVTITFPEASLDTCELFLNFYINRIQDIRLSIPPPTENPSAPILPLSCLNHFQPVCLSQLAEII